MTSKDEVVSFYNRFARYQEKVAFNERHLFLYESLRQLGLGKKSNVLELGCGTGVISSLLLRAVKSGRILGVDISPEAIQLARSRNRHRNAEFIASDLLDLRLQDGSFDFITLFDVIEHIPLEQHALLFRLVSDWMGHDSLLVINIPNPEYTEYLTEHDPDALQVIDLQVTADIITRNAYQNGLVLDFFKTHDVWRMRDYQLMAFRKKRPFVEILVRPGRGSLSMLKNTISRMIHTYMART